MFGLHPKPFRVLSGQYARDGRSGRNGTPGCGNLRMIFRIALDPGQRQIADRGRLAFQQPGGCFFKMGYVLFVSHTPDYRLMFAENGVDQGNDADADQEQRPERAHIEREAEQGAKRAAKDHESQRADSY